MKTLIWLSAFILYAYLPQMPPQKRVFSIGKFHYQIEIEKSYAHDDRWDTEFFIVHMRGQTKDLCSAYLSATRNDSTFVKGYYVVYADRIEFSESYFYHQNNNLWVDSTKKIFYPDKNGKLMLKAVKDFKNGETKTTAYK